MIAGPHAPETPHDRRPNAHLGRPHACRRGARSAPRDILVEGVRLGVGADATNTSDGQNMFESPRLAACLSRISDPDPARWIDAGEAFETETIGSVETLGLVKLGRLAPGWAAEMVFLDLGHITYVPLRAPLRQMVFAESGASVRSVTIAGRMVLDEGRMTTVDEANLRARAEAAVERVDSADAETIRAADAMANPVGCVCLAHAKRPCDTRRAAWDCGAAIDGSERAASLGAGVQGADRTARR